MNAVKGPDSQTLEEIIRTHQTPLLRLCTLYLHDVHLAEDAVQETFIKAVNHWEDFRGEASAKTWLTRIAVRTCIDMRRTSWFRRIDRRVTLDSLPDIPDEATRDDRELTLAVMNLPPKLKDAIVLYYYQDMNMNDIAKLLRISQPSVSNRLKRGREKLKAYLEKEEEP